MASGMDKAPKAKQWIVTFTDDSALGPALQVKTIEAVDLAAAISIASTFAHRNSLFVLAVGEQVWPPA